MVALVELSPLFELAQSIGFSDQTPIPLIEMAVLRKAAQPAELAGQTFLGQVDPKPPAGSGDEANQTFFHVGI